jgi:predicted metal-dependent hydrolase
VLVYQFQHSGSRFRQAYFTLGLVSFPFNYQRRVSRSLGRISIKLTPAGEVIVLAPKILPTFILEKFLSTKQNWIVAKLAEIQAKKPEQKNLKANQVALFGKTLPLVTTHELQKPPGLTVTPIAVIHNHWETGNTQKTAQQLQQQLTALYKRTAEKYFVTRTKQMAASMKVTYGKLTLRAQQSRWGSCSSQGNLNFNWQLIHYPPAVIDYVIIHELAHLVHHNHSAAFWQLVAKYDPAVSQHKGWLKRHGSTVL